MLLDTSDALYASQIFIDYFNQFQTIVDYQSYVKTNRTNSFGYGTLFHPSDDFFQSWDMKPEDFEIEIREVGVHYTPEQFVIFLDLVSSLPNEANIPGKRIQLVVVEKKTNTILGFIHLASPIISIKPRHDWLGGVPNMEAVNRHCIMGNVIVPVQPFGFNYLGGKLIALICTSNEVRDIIHRKYSGCNIVTFETTSLYGSTKGASMYDGLKPFLRFRGETVSDLCPNLHENIFRDLEKWFTARNGDEPLIPAITPRPNNPTSPTTSRKMRCQNKMKAIIRNSLKTHGLLDQLNKFDNAIKHGTSLTEKKRYYSSDLGYSNVSDVILNGAEPIINPVNYDKFNLDYIVQWWKNKASKRYSSLVESGELRTRLELWDDPDSIKDVIR
jgi:hypothetical protein